MTEYQLQSLIEYLHGEKEWAACRKEMYQGLLKLNREGDRKEFLKSHVDYYEGVEFVFNRVLQEIDRITGDCE